MSSTIATKHLREKLKEEDLLPSPTNQIVLSLTSAKGTNLMLRSPPRSWSPVHFVLLSFQTHLVVLELPNARASPRAGHLSKAKVHVTSLLGFGFMRLSSTSSQNQAGSRLHLSNCQWFHAKKMRGETCETEKSLWLRNWEPRIPWATTATTKAGLLLTTWLTIWYANLACWCAPWSNLRRKIVTVGPREHATKIGFMQLQKEKSYKPTKMKLATSLAYEWNIEMISELSKITSRMACLLQSLPQGLAWNKSCQWHVIESSIEAFQQKRIRWLFSSSAPQSKSPWVHCWIMKL